MAGRRALVALAALAVLTAGCASPGGDGQPEGGPGATTATPTGLPTPDGDTAPAGETEAESEGDAGVDESDPTPNDGDTGADDSEAEPTPRDEIGADGDLEATATADHATTATRAAAEVPPPEVDVLLNCTLLRVTVTPEAWHYRLYLRYRHTDTGRQRRIAAGIFSGTVTDHFGRTDLVLVAVEVRVTGFGPVLRTRPTRCAE